MPHAEIYHFPNSMNEEDELRFGRELRTLIARHFPTSEGKVSLILTPIAKEKWKTEIVEPRLLSNRKNLTLEPDYLD